MKRASTAGPPPPDAITPREMFAAFGMPRSTFERLVGVGPNPIPKAKGSAGVSQQQRWTRAQLPDICAALRWYRREIPAGWNVAVKR